IFQRRRPYRHSSRFHQRPLWSQLWQHNLLHRARCNLLLIRRQSPAHILDLNTFPSAFDTLLQAYEEGQKELGLRLKSQ
ncbi:hypothetical protein CSPX01_17007, partial [Colletotrichum filicis]